MQMNQDNESIEIRMLLEAVYLKYGYDFRGYAQSTLQRRLQYLMAKSGLPSISSMQHEVLNNAAFFESVVTDLTINVTSMFRDPSFYLALRKNLIPMLQETTQINVWSAGCATGEEAYSLAILLQEAGPHQEARIYATDIDEVALRRAALGVYPIDRMQEYTRNYRAAGGENSFVDYFTADDNLVMMSDVLKRNLVFSDHSLATDSVFCEMDLIICRNVLIYFNDELKNRVFKLFLNSLRPGGLLCLGQSESIKFNSFAHHFQEISASEKIYRKVENKRVGLYLVGSQGTLVAQGV